MTCNYFTYSTVAVCFAFVLFAGCSDPKKASNSNFKRVLQEYHSEDSPCFDVEVQFPLTYEAEHMSSLFGGPMYSIGETREATLVKTLVDAGIVVDTSGSDSDDNLRIATLTDFGESIAKSHDDDSESSENSDGTEFCWGSGYHVDEVTRYTEPTSQLGITISMVTYTLSVKNPVEWPGGTHELPDGIQRMIFPSLFGYYSSSQALVSAEPESQETELVLMGDGWAHISAIE